MKFREFLLYIWLYSSESQNEYCIHILKARIIDSKVDVILFICATF